MRYGMMKRERLVIMGRHYLMELLLNWMIPFCYNPMPSRNEVWDDKEGEVGHYGKALSSGTSIELDDPILLQSHRWVLNNTYEVQPWKSKL
jgi:hypothetical protein